MNAVATEKPKRKAKATNGTRGRISQRLIDSVRSTSPDETGTTTPAGIAANDPDALAVVMRDGPESQQLAWQLLRPRLSELCGIPSIESVDHLQVSLWLDRNFQADEEDLDAAQAMVQKYGDLLSTPPAQSVASAKSAANQSAADGADRKRELRNFGGGTVSRINWAHCVPHPDNDPSREDEIDSLAESLKTETMLEKPVVRPIGSNKQGTIWQIISGHRRIAAARKLGWKEGDAHVIQCDNARALELVAIYNAKRQDLTPIAKAKMIERLCQPVDKGGSGFTREQAAKVYDLESGAAASNLVRLLELPKVWQNRVAAGELPWTFARELLPIVHAPRLVERLDKSWELHAKGRQCELCNPGTDCWETRRAVEEMIETVVTSYTRPVMGEERHYGYSDLNHVIHANTYDYYGSYPVLFDVTPELEEQLDIHEFQVGKEKQRRATNVKLYDKHQVPAIKKHVDERTKKKAAKAGQDKPAAKKPLTPAQQKAREKEQAGHLENRIDEWRRRWLASLILDHVEQDHLLASWIALLVAAGQWHRPRENYMLAKQPPHPVAEAFREHGASAKHDDLFEMCQQLSGKKETFGAALADGAVAIARELLVAAAGDGFSPLDYEAVDALASFVGLDIQACWRNLQAVGIDAPKDARYQAFYELHQTAQLDSLGNELGVHVEHVKGKEQKVHLLTSCPRTLKLPKSIKPVAGVAKGKAPKKGSKR